jgi:cell division septal protein FtsQ
MTRTARQAGAKRNIRDRRIKPRNHRKPNIKLLAGLFAISAGIGCVSSYAVQAPGLVIRQIEIHGIHYADKAPIQEAARSVLGKNILLLRKGPVIGRIRSVHEVESVTMGRTPPDKVWVRLKERKAEAVLACGDSRYLVQSDGLVFHKTDSPVAGLPLVNVVACGRVREGQTCSSPGVLCALSIAKSARERRLAITKISVDRLGDICLNMGSGVYVKLGQPDEMARKLTLLQKALAFKPSLAREAAYIDLSCPNGCVWKPKSGGASAS